MRMTLRPHRPRRTQEHRRLTLRVLLFWVLVTVGIAALIRFPAGGGRGADRLAMPAAQRIAGADPCRQRLAVLRAVSRSRRTRLTPGWSDGTRSDRSGPDRSGSDGSGSDRSRAHGSRSDGSWAHGAIPLTLVGLGVEVHSRPAVVGGHADGRQRDAGQKRSPGGRGGDARSVEHVVKRGRRAAGAQGRRPEKLCEKCCVEATVRMIGYPPA